ncbi:hypothetical protein [Neisseria lactamica]|uniref:hypothetical protein n=1 Tax=Neisseria lactamica TaxID=486 RepID=UPI0002E52971|nr:hypothetical protein [Neisseria lactamica]
MPSERLQSAKPARRVRHFPSCRKKAKMPANRQGAAMQNQNTRPVKIELKGEAGKRVLLAAARRIAKTHQKAVKALADK